MGQIAILHPNYWLFHYHSAKINLEKIKKLHKKILYIPPDKSNFRLLSNKKLIYKFYNQGTQLVTNTYLSFEHLTSSILDKLLNVFQDNKIRKHENDDLCQKLNFVLNYMKLDDLNKEIGYSYLFSEIERTRHNINHPRRYTTFNSNEFEWDNVPLAWLVAEKYKNINQTFNLLEKIDKEANQFFETLPKKATTITVERGIQSLNHTQILKRK